MMIIKKKLEKFLPILDKLTLFFLSFFLVACPMMTKFWSKLFAVFSHLAIWPLFTTTQIQAAALFPLANAFFVHPRSRKLPPPFRLRLKCAGTRAEIRFRLSAKRTSPFKSAGASLQSTTGNPGVRINDSDAGYTTFRGSVKGTGYTLHSPVSPSLPRTCVAVCITFQLYSTLA